MRPDDHLFLQSTAARYGLYFSRPGNGICHQVHLERFGVPGQTLLGSDSHTPTAGGLGMLAMGAGGMDVALAPRYLGVVVVLAQSFARLHRANLINFGVLPVVIKDDDYEHIEQGDTLEIMGLRNAVAESDEVVVRVKHKAVEFAGRLELSQRERKILLAGGCLNFHRQELANAT